MDRKREEWIDNLKGIGIILIVLGHCSFPHDSILIKYLFTFHVALFFFLSGFLFSQKKEVTFTKYLRLRFNRLIIPYIAFNVIAYLIFGMVSKKLNLFSLEGFEKFIRNLLIGNYTGNHDTSILDIATWFLPCLFFTGLYYFVLDKLVGNKIIKFIIICILSILLFIESKFIDFRLPWGMDIAFMGLFLYGVGNIFKSEIKKLVEKINGKHIILIPFLVGLNLLLISDINWSTNNYGNYLKFVLGSASGILTLTIVSRKIGKSFLTFFGVNTIIVLCMEWTHGLMYAAIVLLSFNTLPKEPGYLSGSVQFLSYLILIVPTIFIINRYFYFLLGSKKALKSN